MHTDAVAAGRRVLIVDDVLATGGTAAAACTLVERLGGVVSGVAVLVELGSLAGRSRLSGTGCGHWSRCERSVRSAGGRTDRPPADPCP